MPAGGRFEGAAMSRDKRVVVLGAGPVGLEAAAALAARGAEPTLVEAGDVACHVAAWGHVRLFTPFGMNAGPAGRRLLAGMRLPPDDAALTGAELREAYLLPLAERLAGAARLETGTRVVAVARSRYLKGDALGDPARATDPFRLLVERDGVEAELEAGVVLDCTGTYGRPNHLGPGGAPAVGERALDGRIVRGVPDIAGADRGTYAARRTLLVGAGHSAATAALALSELARAVPGTSFLWATRADADRPLPAIAADTLPPRAALVQAANALAAAPPAGSAWLGGARVVALRDAGGAVEVTLRHARGDRVDRFDRVVALVGYEPDDSIYRQLQIHECYASRAPMKLAAALLAASGAAAGDCLALGGFGPETLRSPEPGYFILGAKSYGRTSAFLLRTGYEQVEDVVGILGAGDRAAG
ncbi:MAG TPA: FAD-dependent oxidoreductase [Longimicrobiales bacterium]|nr:FAD-dependent oxidoreductase [Longimicrobiales bacterium]